MAKPKIAIVHDAFAVRGGAERLAFYISKVFPDAPLFTSVYLREKTFEELKDKKITTQPLASIVKNEKQFKSLFPIWFLQMRFSNFNEFDYLLTSSTYLAKFIPAPDNGKHICYLHTPFRFIWNRQSYTQESLPLNPISVKLIDNFLPTLQHFDYKFTHKINQIITNSKNMQTSINQVYGKDAKIIYPPVETNQYFIDKPQDFYLCVGRMISHKRLDLAIQACNVLKRKLVIVGDGLERPNLERIAGDSIQFHNNVDNLTLKKLYATCKALIFPSNEDLGMVPIEVQASGRPVIAYKAGGALETVREGVSGMFFENQSIDDIIQAIIDFENEEFSPNLIRASVQRFDFENFRNQYLELVR